MTLSSNLEAPMYLILFHGRKDTDEDLDDWGEAGPIFPIRGSIQCTYMWDIFLDTGGNGRDGELQAKVNDLVYYDGWYYGDWIVVPAGNLDEVNHHRVQEFEPEKAAWKDK